MGVVYGTPHQPHHLGRRRPGALAALLSGWPGLAGLRRQRRGVVAFLHTSGAVLALYPRRDLAADANIPETGSGFGGIALAHNVRAKKEVDSVIAEAVKAGGSVLKAGHEADWGGYSGYFVDPDGYPWEVAWNPFFPMDADGSVQLPD